jgi:5,10-methylenetetrahydromethanopterin reductase
VHPVEIAGQVAALDLASHGRAFLGLAAGSWLGELGVEQRRPLATVREAWEVVVRLLAGDRSGFVGDVFRLEPGRGLEYEVERDGVPLLVGTWSPGLMGFAREHAAELKIGGCANPAMVRLARQRVGDDVAVVVGAVTVADEDERRAREHARRHVAMYLAVVGELDPTVELDPEMLAAVRDGDAAAIPDDVLDLFAFAGTPERIRAHADALFAAGASRVEFGNPVGLELLVQRLRPG